VLTSGSAGPGLGAEGLWWGMALGLIVTGSLLVGDFCA
jgi:hypothetical protein